MGYTHSWFVNPQTPQQRWDKALDAVRPLVRLAAADGVITGGDGYGEPSIEGDIWFNGRAEDDCDCETFYLPASMEAVRVWMLEQRWDPWGFFFCKTQRKPYDRVVVGCLAALAAALGPAYVHVESDGARED